MGKNIKQKTPERPERQPVYFEENSSLSAGDLEEFRLRFPVDEDAFNYLASSPGDVQRVVLRDFKPPREDSDYSALLIKFTKRVRESAKSRPHLEVGHPVSLGATMAWPQPPAPVQWSLQDEVLRF